MTQTISLDQVRHIARLSRIAVDESRLADLARQLGGILAYFDKLKELDTADVPPLVRPVELSNVLADDQPQLGLSLDAALANAPHRQGDFYMVPKVIGESS